MSKLVYYSQEDAKWKNVLYSIRNDKSQTIGTSACGPTSAAMAISSLTGKAVLPTVAAAYAIKNGFRTQNEGTSWGYFASIAKQYGLICKQTGSLDDVKKALITGKLVVASMGKGHFTGGGHYVLLVRINTAKGMIDVYDPNHDNTKYGSDGLIDQGIRNDGKVTARESVFKGEAKQYWIFEKEKEELEMKPVDANGVIAYLKLAHAVAKTPAERMEIGRLADLLRVASGQAKKNG
ncbi:C39 family peptidase [Paenibacillus sp. DS2015]|uniref:C39 family peptidase n=1 Tax=Paenibacillus sp. DS2015 TaxID=3373917 RepID=UPI003D215719